VELSDRHRLFVGFKLDGSLRHQLRSLSGPDTQYVGEGETAFLRLCKRGNDTYVGKVVEERLTTDRVDDVRRNVLSIIARLCPDTRLPRELEIWVCEPEGSPVEP
jgi:hypothetical protein